MECFEVNNKLNKNVECKKDEFFKDGCKIDEFLELNVKRISFLELNMK